jgi:diguanylate cyclase (GGDEF)-like protein/PAS domain S-box-containing protein
MNQEVSLEDLYENVPCGLLSTTPEGEVIKVNQTMLDWTGSDRASVIGRPFTDLLAPGSQLFYETRLLPVLRLEGEVREVALSMRRNGDQPLPVLINSTLVKEGDSATLVRMAVFDATARQDYERQLLAARRAAEESESSVRVLQEAASAFGASATETALAEALAESCRTALAATATAVVLMDDSGESWLAAGEHPLSRFAFENARSPEMDRIRRAGMITVSTVDEVEEWYPALADAMIEARIEAFSVVPLVDSAASNPESMVGALLCFFGRRRTFEPQQLDLQVALARQATQVLARLRLQAELKTLALHDQLTGLPNRELLRERMAQALGSALWNEHSLALIMLDLDGFKAVNDTLGHAVGDLVLRQAADRMRSVIRGSDIVARFGGDEFVIICEDIDNDAVLQVAERIRSALSESTELVTADFPMSASLGIAMLGPTAANGMTAEAMFVAADAAMYRSKEAGKNTMTLVEL